MNRKLFLALGLMLPILGLSGSPVSAEPFDPIAATDAILAQIPAEDRAQSDSYFEGGYYLDAAGTLLSILIGWVFLRYGWSARIRDRVTRISSWAGIQTLIYIPIYTTFAAVLIFPFTFYREFIREHAYGFATQSFGPWISEQGLAFAISLLLSTVLIALLYVAIRRWPTGWWVRVGASAVFLIIVLQMLAPIYIMPLFNDYEPLDEGDMRDRILSMARANGVPAEEVYQVNSSKQTTRVSANVSGAFGTTRISLNDNLLNRATPEEVEVVMAHEAGHYVLNHVIEMAIQMAIVFFVGFGFIHFSFTRLQARFGDKWGVDGITDIAGLPLLLLLLSVYSYATTPVVNTIIRSNEAEADIFAINVTQDPDAWASTQLMLIEYRKAEPGRWEELLLYDHPAPRTRILMAMKWKAEHLSGEDE
jgi:STE24 endopeptidase